MILYVTLPEAKRHLNQDQSCDDCEIMNKCLDASAAVADFLKDRANPDWSPGNVPRNVRAATLITLEHLYRRDLSDNSEMSEPGYLPQGATSLLWRMRNPAMS